jgi:hypothetical protein
MYSDNLFEKGARWRHKNLGFDIFIRQREPGDQYVVGFYVPEENMFERNFHVPGIYSKQELTFEFDPVLPWNRYRLLLEDDWI